MALNKRKVLDAARKHAQKGAKSKALKEYNKLLKEDPSDAKLLLEVGDAYRRWGQPDEAISQYGKVAAQYRNVGFDARAVAVFKQILNLDPKHYDAYISLAELYQRMGLDSDAIASLQRAADGYHKEGRKAEALELLRQMAALDPSNTTSRLKVAELLRQEGMEEDALAEYLAVAKELENQPDVVVTVLQRILELRPDHLETLIALARNLISAGELDRAEPPALRALKVSGEPEQHELLMDLYAQAGSEAKLADATRGLAKLYRERGEEDKARELIQRLPAAGVGTQSAATSSARLAVDVSEASEPTLDDGELLEDEPFLALDGNLDLGAPSSGIDTGTSMDPGSGLDEIELDARRQAPSAAKKNQQVALPEGDPDQLLAEASVYLRYGKGEQAIASLRGVIAQDPKHRAALEKLGEAYAEDGQNSEAVEVWLRAAEQIRADGDASALEILRDRIAALDPALAEQIEPIEASATDSSMDSEASISSGAAEATRPDGVEFELDLEVELDLDQAIDEVAESGTDLELDFDAQDEGSSDDIEFDEDDSIEIEIDPGDLSGSESTPASEAGATVISESALNEEIEEAEFYIAQDMFEEAMGILGRVLKLAPDHVKALLLMGEIQAADAEQAAGSETPSAAAADARQLGVETTFRLDDDEDDDTPDGVASVEGSADDDSEVEIDVELDLDGDDDTSLDDAVEVPSEVTDAEAVAGPKAAEEPVDADESFDLRKALADVLDEDSEVDPHDTSGVLSTVEDGFESIFSDFKKGVSATL
ncbi:MAG: tetratricopeptide repeat protein, partial [Myxococcota bacterium]